MPTESFSGQAPLPPFDASMTNSLAAIFDTIVPPGEFPGGWAGGVEKLLREHLHDFLDWYIPILFSAISSVDRLAMHRHARAFQDVPLDDRTAILATLLEVEAGEPPDEDRTQRAPILSTIELAHEGYYGGTNRPTGWSVVGFNPLPAGVKPVEPPSLRGVSVNDVEAEYDVVVIGGGAGGGFAAARLAERGRKVLLIERSRPMRDAELRDNHLQGKRSELFDVIAGPGRDSPRVLELSDGSTRLLRGDGSGTDYGLVAMTLGGGTRVWQGMSWRFLEEDFRMASTYGVPEDSTLTDWPFEYEELEPYYEHVEWDLGVSGDSGSPAGTRAPRKRNLPMPALGDNGMRQPFTEAAQRLGWKAFPIPFAINSVPRAGRAACVRCPQCVGHTCPVDAKNGTHNTVIPRALATGNCTLLMSTQVVSVNVDSRGQAIGITGFHHDATGSVREVNVRAHQVVVAAGAMETPRLLLASGIGNEWVGRNHHTHAGAAAYSMSPPTRKEYVGPGHSVSTLDFVHAGGAPWGGGVIFDLAMTLPVAKAAMSRRDGAAFGAEHTEWMKRASLPYGTMSMVQEVPHAKSRVSIDPRVRDRYGMPVARLRGEAHPASVEAAEFMRDRCVDWLIELGGTSITSEAHGGGSRGAEHSAGTTRMGADPALAACDPQGRLYGTTNVYVADASLHPTNGGLNPGLTAMACALRVATLMP